MKIVKFLAAAATEAGATATAATVVAMIEPTSEALTKLRADRKAKWAEVIKLDPESVEGEAGLKAVYAIDGQIKAEIANIQKAKKDEELAMARNARIAIGTSAIDDSITAALHYATVLSKIPEAKRTQADNDAMNALTEKAKASKEKLDNELTARYAASTPAKVTTTGTAGTDKVAGTKGEKTSLLLEAHLVNVAAGMTDAQSRTNLEDIHGGSRSTVWHVVNNYNKANAKPQV